MKMNMEQARARTYKGYLAIPRGALLPFLNPARFLEFGIFVAFAIECDWDKRHMTYGCLMKSNQQLAAKWGCNATTVWRWKKKMISMDLIEIHGGSFKIKNFEWFELSFAKEIADIPLARRQDLIANTKHQVAETQENIANTQSSQVRDRPQSSNLSFNGDLISSQDEALTESDHTAIDKWIENRRLEEK